MRRGLTLLETLIATAILAMIAAACVPMIARATVLLRHRDRPSIRAADLALAADAFLNNPAAFGIKAKSLHEIDYVQIGWLSALDQVESAPMTPIDVRSMRTADTKVKHIWLVFECDGVSVWRWLAVPDRESEASSP